MTAKVNPRILRARKGRKRSLVFDTVVRADDLAECGAFAHGPRPSTMGGQMRETFVEATRRGRMLVSTIDVLGDCDLPHEDRVEVMRYLSDADVGVEIRASSGWAYAGERPIKASVRKALFAAGIDMQKTKYPPEFGSPEPRPGVMTLGTAMDKSIKMKLSTALQRLGVVVTDELPRDALGPGVRFEVVRRHAGALFVVKKGDVVAAQRMLNERGNGSLAITKREAAAVTSLSEPDMDRAIEDMRIIRVAFPEARVEGILVRTGGQR